jgi:hypothetical protein
VNIELFEMSDNSGVAMAMGLQLLNNFFFIHKILAHVENEESNLQTCVSALNLVVSSVSFSMLKPFDGPCFWVPYQGLPICDDFFTYEKIFHGLSYTFIKIVQVDIQKCITQSNKSLGKGRQLA